DRPVKALLLVEDDEKERSSIGELIGGVDVEVTPVKSSEEALQALEEREYDCMISDLVLPTSDGFQLIEKVRSNPRNANLPIIVSTGKDLSREEEQQLKKHVESVIVKNATESHDRLLDDTALFLHRVKQRGISPSAHGPVNDPSLKGKKVLVVDDDVRNIFAM